jgi:Ca2+-binding EF-hand superfamily protein
MKNSNVKLAVAALAILAGMGVAQAQDRREEGPMSFESLDLDGSGEITVEDMDAMRAARFAELDTDGDGSVSEAEFVAHAEARAAERAAEMFARLDADGDGTLSRDVLESRGGRGFGPRMLSRLDSDGSGGISAEEFESARERMSIRQGARAWLGPSSQLIKRAAPDCRTGNPALCQ